MDHLNFDFDDGMGAADGGLMLMELMYFQVNSVEIHYDSHNVAYAFEENLLMGHLD